MHRLSPRIFNSPQVVQVCQHSRKASVPHESESSAARKRLSREVNLDFRGTELAVETMMTTNFNADDELCGRAPTNGSHLVSRRMEGFQRIFNSEGVSEQTQNLYNSAITSSTRAIHNRIYAK